MTTVDQGATISVDGLKYSLTDDTAILVGCDPNLTSVAVPETLHHRPVTTVSSGAFAQCTALTAVELPTNIEILESAAFEGCTALLRVFLPYRLKSIGPRAFADCAQLREVPHYVWAGPKNDGKLMRSLAEPSLPIQLEEIGEAAFAGCQSLVHMAIPYQVRVLPEAIFEGCTSLESVWLHNALTEIGAHAFANCAGLKRLTIPASVARIGTDAIAQNTLIVGPADSEAARYAQRCGLRTDGGSLPDEPIVSAMGVDEGHTVTDVLQSQELTENLLNKYEIRPAVAEIHRFQPSKSATPIRPSRFQRENGVYHSQHPSTPGETITITMVGDLMCGFRQQRSALRDGVYDFTANFDYVKPVFERADLALGNLESVVSESYPYMKESLYVDDRPHLNAPFAYLAAVRDAGIDAALCAQNHMFDAGPKGVLETLDALNRAELAHTGMFADPREPRHLIFEIKGIKVGVVAYLDPARQLMKQANFTPDAIRTMASHFDADRIAEDIRAARAEGAEFILAYCHWGKEYTHRVMRSQSRYAQMVADAGADYIFGSHSHNLQHYRVLRSHDGREVPVIYSGGNFVSDIVRKQPIAQDSMIASLVLGRDDSGRVVVESDGYLPCRIIDDKRNRRGRFTTVPLSTLMDGELGYSKKQAAEDSRRIAQVMGAEYRTLAIADAPTPPPGGLTAGTPLPFTPTSGNGSESSVRDAEGRRANTYDLRAYAGLPKMGEANQVFQELALGYGLSTVRTGWKDVAASDSNGRRIAFGIAYSDSLSQMPEVIAGNKQLTRQFLHAAGVPAPKGRIFRMDEVDSALAYADELGYPVVVKPVGGKSGRGVTAGITDAEGVRWAVEQIGSGTLRRGRFILEDHVPGQDYRIYVAYGEVLSVIVRKPAFVLGDGVRTIEQLVEVKNAIRRKNPHTRARLIKRNAASTHRLQRQGLDWDDVPDNGTEVVLAAAANISQGGDSTDVTAETHPSILEAAKNAAAAFPGLDQAGVDFLLADHRQDVTEQQGGICEINTIPALMANQVPVFGEVRPVADTVFCAAAEGNQVKLADYQERVRVAVRVQGISDPERFATWIGIHARRLGLGGRVRSTGQNYLRIHLQGQTARVAALIGNMFTGRRAAWPDWVTTEPTWRNVPATFVEELT